MNTFKRRRIEKEINKILLDLPSHNNVYNKYYLKTCMRYIECEGIEFEKATRDIYMYVSSQYNLKTLVYLSVIDTVYKDYLCMAQYNEIKLIYDVIYAMQHCKAFFDTSANAEFVLKKALTQQYVPGYVPYTCYGYYADYERDNIKKYLSLCGISYDWLSAVPSNEIFTESQ